MITTSSSTSSLTSTSRSDIGDSPVPTPPPRKTAEARRVKPAFKGPSTKLWEEGEPDGHLGENSEKPVKADEPIVHKPKRERGVGPIGRLITPPHLRVPLNVDEEIVAYLQCEYAFRPRTPELLPQMANKARQFLARYDCTDLSWRRRADLVIQCVGAAFDPTQAEFAVRQHLRDPVMTEERHKQNALLTEGKVTNGSGFWAKKLLPKSKP